jgi:serine protease
MTRYTRATMIAALIAIVMAAPMALAQDAQPENDGRYIIKLKNLNGGAQMVAAAGGRVVHELGPQSALAAYLPEAALNGLRNNPNVEYIELDARRYLMAETSPYGIAMVQANDAVFNNNNSAGCTVCIIDSGYYRAHEDLDGDGSVTGTNDSGTGFWYEDSCGHGTHVAGTVAALKGNAKGVVGVNSNGTLNVHVEKVFNGTDCKWTYSSNLITALNRCKANARGKLVVSMSLGGSFSSTTESNAFQTAYNEGVLSIAAAGNDGSTRRSYPASYPSVISVAAVDSAGVVASFSQKNADVELAAPGVGVLSTTPFKISTVTAGGSTYIASNIDGSARTSRSGTLVSGGLCNSVGAWSGNVVLCERGVISFADKVNNVRLGGGVAAAIYNNVDGGFAGTLNGSSTIPAVSMARADGLAALGGVGSSATVDNVAGVAGQSYNGYEYYDGTSMATPHVSGVAALVWSNFPNKSNAEIRDALQKTALDKGAAGKDNSYGWGIVQAKAAYDLLAGSGGTTPPPGEDPPPPGDGDTTPPVISDVASAKTHAKNGRFEITWKTNEPATSAVTFTGGATGTYTSSTLATSHAFSFNGKAGTTYTYTVSSTDAAGNTSTAGPFTHQN